MGTAAKGSGDNLTLGFEQLFLGDVGGFAADGGQGPATTDAWGCPGGCRRGLPSTRVEEAS